MASDLNFFRKDLEDSRCIRFRNSPQATIWKLLLFSTFAENASTHKQNAFFTSKSWNVVSKAKIKKY